MWWPRIALTLSILAAALLVFSGLGVRAGLWPFRVGFGMFAGAMLAGLAAIGAASIALAVPRLRHPKRILIAALAARRGERGDAARAPAPREDAAVHQRHHHRHGEAAAVFAAESL